MLDAIRKSMTVLSFSRIVHARCILQSTQSNCCSAKLSTSFLLSYGTITLQSLTPMTMRLRESKKIPPHLKCVTTLPCEIWMLKIATELALIIQSRVNRTG